METRIHNATIVLSQGDITEQDVDAIVNAANKRLAGGGGVDGAIHRAGGPAIMEECRKIGGCPTGTAVITTGGNLPANYVIHTVGPVYRNGTSGEPELLKNAYLNSLKLADQHNVKTIAFPSISTGAYGYPLKDAAKIALSAVKDYIKTETNIKKIYFVLFSSRDFEVYRETLSMLMSK